MKWSWRVGRIAGIDIHIHATLPLLFAWIAFVALRGGATAAMVRNVLALIMATFALVVLHECAHALMARRFGVRTRDIILLPIGGIARLERMPRQPRAELLVALAGPAVNVVLAIGLYGVLALMGDASQLRMLVEPGDAATSVGAITQLFAVNVSLAFFNLLPAFPLDGGRALRALLAMGGRDYAKATLTAARIGRVFALLFSLAGLFVLANPMLVVIALFIWLSAASEAAAVQTAVALEDVPLDALLITDIRTLAPDDPLSHAADLVLHGFQQDFPVIREGALVGMLGRGDLVRGLATLGREGTVHDAMRRDFQAANAQDTAEQALQQLTTARLSALPVVRDGTLLGMLTVEHVMEFLLLRDAGRRAASRVETSSL